MPGSCRPGPHAGRDAEAPPPLDVVDGVERVDHAPPWQTRPAGMLAPGTLATSSSVAAMVLVFTSSARPAVLVLLLVVSASAVSGSWWARRRRRLEPPSGHRAAVLARFLHAWATYLCLLTAGPLAFGSSDDAGDWADLGDLAFPLAQSVLLSVMFAQFRSTRRVADPAGQRPGSHLTRRQRSEIAVGLRADHAFEAARDRDVRAVIHRVLDRELVGWGAVAAAILILTVIPQALEVSPWLLAAVVLAATAIGIVGWRTLAVVRAAKRRQVWLNAHRPAPHLERPERGGS